MNSCTQKYLKAADLECLTPAAYWNKASIMRGTINVFAIYAFGCSADTTLHNNEFWRLEFRLGEFYKTQLFYQCCFASCMMWVWLPWSVVSWRRQIQSEKQHFVSQTLLWFLPLWFKFKFGKEESSGGRSRLLFKYKAVLALIKITGHRRTPGAVQMQYICVWFTPMCNVGIFSLWISPSYLDSCVWCSLLALCLRVGCVKCSAPVPWVCWGGAAHLGLIQERPELIRAPPALRCSLPLASLSCSSVHLRNSMS